MNDIKFSVVIPLYNKEQSIVNTVLSVLKQSYQNFEIVIINDGSTDNSVKAMKTIQDERIRLIHQENQGVSAARNLGIKEASYEWIAFLDGDDLWESDHLQEIINMIQLYPKEKVFVTSFEYSDKRVMYRHNRVKSIFLIKDYFKEVVKEELIWTSIVVVNKKCFDKVGLFNTNLNRGEDLDVWARLAKKFSIVKSSKITAIYRVDAENRTNLSRDLEKCHYYNYEFNNTAGINEVKYYKFFLFNRIFEYFLLKDFKNAKILLNRYPQVSKIEFIFFLFNLFNFVMVKKLRKFLNC